MTAFALVYGAGAPFNCPSQVRSSELGAQLLGFCNFGGLLRNSPIVSYHFQHPWTVGLPIGLCLLLVVDAAPRRAPRWIAMLWLLATLAISQVVLFASLAAALPVAELANRKHRGWTSVGLTVVAVLGAIGLASRTGGFFGSGPAGLGLEFHLGVANTLTGSLDWIVRVFGFLLILGVLGHFWARRPVLVYGLLALGGLAVIDTIRYKQTWDIVKFATVATIGLAIPSAVALARLVANKAPLPRILGVLGFAAVVASGVGAHAALLLDLAGVPAMYRRTPPSMPQDDAQAAAWLRRNMPATTVMYRNQRQYLPYAVWAGLPQAWFDARHAHAAQPTRERTALLRRMPADPAAYLAQGLRFFVLEPADRQVVKYAEKWIATGAAVERVRFGKIRIIELRQPRPG
jgi:hypothetical protein